MPRLNPHPMQHIVRAEDDVIRFRANKIVGYLLDAAMEAGVADLNKIATMNFSQEDRMQLAQLIGYSVSGYADLSYASDESIREALVAHERLISTVPPDLLEPAAEALSRYLHPEFWQAWDAGTDQFRLEVDYAARVLNLAEAREKIEQMRSGMER